MKMDSILKWQLLLFFRSHFMQLWQPFQKLMSNHTNWEHYLVAKDSNFIVFCQEGAGAGFCTAADLIDLNLSLLCFYHENNR